MSSKDLEQLQREADVAANFFVPITVAAAGTNLATATVLLSHCNVVTTCAAGAGVVVRPDYTVIYNRSANAVLAYPPGNAQFESLGAGNPVSIAVGAKAEFFMTSATQGYAG